MIYQKSGEKQTLRCAQNDAGVICYAESFRFAQDKLRDGSAFEIESLPTFPKEENRGVATIMVASAGSKLEGIKIWIQPYRVKPISRSPISLIDNPMC